jgi:hypothetical protein
VIGREGKERRKEKICKKDSKTIIQNEKRTDEGENNRRETNI